MQQPMHDIENRDDIATVISAFYAKAMQDAVIGHYFTVVTKLNLKTHLPVMYDFWESILFQSHKYHGNALHKHFLLNNKAPFRPEHFERWLQLFQETVDAHFVGTVADTAKSRAHSIAFSIQQRMSGPVPLMPRSKYSN